MEQLKPYHPHKEEMIKINKGKRFQQAVDAVEEFLRKTKGKDQVSGFFLTVCIKASLGMNGGQMHFYVKGVCCLWQVEEGFVYIALFFVFSPLSSLLPYSVLFGGKKVLLN